MTLQQLEYVMAVYRFGHFAKAADHCNVTQPTLSSMIQKLEEELGLRIFDRKRKPVVPTQAGMKVIEQVWKVLSRARKLRQTVEEEKQTLTGTFRIGVLPTIAPYLIPRFFPQLMMEHSEMDVRVVEMKTADMRRAIRNGDLDAGILARVEDLNDLDCHTLFYEQFYAYVADGDPLHDKDYIKPADLSGEFLWLLDEGHCFRDQLVKFCRMKAAARSKQSYRLGSIETFMRMVEQGKGVTFIPQLAVAQLSEEQRRLVRPFAHPIPTREIVMAVSANFIRRRMLQIISERVRQCLPEDMLTIRQNRQHLV